MQINKNKSKNTKVIKKYIIKNEKHNITNKKYK